MISQPSFLLEFFFACFVACVVGFLERRCALVRSSRMSGNLTSFPCVHALGRMRRVQNKFVFCEEYIAVANLFPSNTYSVQTDRFCILVSCTAVRNADAAQSRVSVSPICSHLRYVFA